MTVTNWQCASLAIFAAAAALALLVSAFNAGQLREARYHCETGSIAACDFLEEIGELK